MKTKPCISTYEDLLATRFSALPKSLRGADIYRTGNVTFAVGSRGTLYVSFDVARHGVTFLRLNKWEQHAAVEAMKLASVLDPKVAAEHKRRADALDYRQEADRLLYRCEKEFEKFGLKLTKTQLRVLRKAAGKEQ